MLRDQNATHPYTPSPRLRQTQTLIPAHLLIIDVPWYTTLPLSSLVCRGTHYNSGSVGRECSGIILPNVLPVPRLTAEPKSTASLSRIIGQCAWFASFHSMLSPVSKMSPGTAGESGIKWPHGKGKLTAEITSTQSHVRSRQMKNWANSQQPSWGNRWCVEILTNFISIINAYDSSTKVL